jgi:hypothetical protein
VFSIASLLLLFLAADVASFQQVDGPVDRWAGEWYAVLLTGPIWLLCFVTGLFILLEDISKQVDVKTHDTLSLSELALKQMVMLLLAVSLAVGYFTAPKRLDGERSMTRSNNISQAVMLGLPLAFVAFGSFVLLLKLLTQKFLQRRALEEPAAPVADEAAEEEPNEQTSLL